MCCNAVVDTNALWRYVFDWVPFLIFIGLLIYFMKKGIGGRQSQYMDASLKYQTEHVAETRKIQASLEKIAAALEQRRSP